METAYCDEGVDKELDQLVSLESVAVGDPAHHPLKVSRDRRRNKALLPAVLMASFTAKRTGFARVQDEPMLHQLGIFDHSLADRA
eukprot:12410715-Karenia_brevis.AAC.1